MNKLSFSYTCGAVVMLCIVLLMNSMELFAGFILAVVIHESGHVLAIYLLGGRVESVYFNIYGVKIGHNAASLSYWKEIICIIAGPAFGIFTAIIAARIGENVFSGINFTVSVFNLLPVRPLDGGQAIFCLISQLALPDTAEKVCTILDVLVIVAILFWGGYMAMLSKGNLTFLFMGIIMTLYYCNEHINSIKSL